MPQNLISAEFTAEQQEATLAAIQQIQSLPFLIGLSNSEKRKLNKMGDKSLAFVDRALSIAKQNPEMLPANFDLEEFKRDVTLYHALTPVTIAISKLNELLDGTKMAVGSDAYTSALEVYAFAKMTKGVSGLEDLQNSLGNRFRSSNGRGGQDTELDSPTI
jgi:hypothetical protein